jgi:DUF4097 and DUF4098 domain-containing protein YvlB
MPDYTFESETPIRMRIRLNRGHLNLTASDSPTITVSVQPYDPDDSRAVETAQRTKVAMHGSALVIESPDSGSFLRPQPKLAVTATVPVDSDASVKVASADIHTSGRLGSLRYAAASGDLDGGDFAGDVSVHSASGQVRIGAIGGGLSVKTASGSVTAARVARDTRVHSASGDIEIGDAGRSVRGHTSSGDVAIGRAHSGRIDAHTASGDLTIGVADGVGVWMDVTTFSGTASSDLPVGFEQPAGGCDLEIRAKAASGDIRIHRAGPEPSGPDLRKDADEPITPMTPA